MHKAYETACKGDSFSTGDVLLEIETDKAQMDVEAQDDGIVAKITVLPNDAPSVTGGADPGTCSNQMVRKESRSAAGLRCLRSQMMI